MLTIKITNYFKKKNPDYCGLFIEADVSNSETSEELQNMIKDYSEKLKDRYNIMTIKERSGILSTRLAYKRLGKDPGRYRPACEQLCRRILQGKQLYKIDSLVDLGNFISLWAGYSVAVLDKRKIVGEVIELGVGEKNEAYEAIGRGFLNIEGLPVFRDAKGGFATPTSDHVRTMCKADTCCILIIVNAYDGDKNLLKECERKIRDLLERFVNCKNFHAQFAYS